MTLILTASVLEHLASMAETISAVERGFVDIARGTAQQPAPLSLHLPSSDARYLLMSGLADTQRLAAVKLLSDIPANREAGLPTQRSSILLADQLTGETLALLDGRVPTRVRTAAASAVASKHLARPDSSTLALIGAGALAIAHVEALLHVLPIKKVVVWSRTNATIQAFEARITHRAIEVVAASSIQEAVEAADVLCTLTPSVEPLVHGEWFRPGLHINAVGARPRPTHREIDSAGMGRSKVFVDSTETAVQKSGDLMLAVSEGAISLDDVRGELGAVISGQIAGRDNDDDITLFNSVGIGMQDLAIGRLLYDAALRNGLGTDVDMSR
ncbi:MULTISPECIES: ornithine cyclodeaminase family protein [unclassified Arthrobacter]|uniref:ornithine cyclodeaminase family protein n=1 Tax=unclassified Arthrobacter TaxID=235627 RepID=UPI0028833D96|nr:MULTISPECIES: ornithine cyclodeaminase family protein [unclassified Arthrobacter]